MGDMNKNLEKYLIEAANTEKSQLSADNPYRDIGFDEEKGRLGWVKTIPFSQIKASLEDIESLLEGKKSVIFVGMGGSINGIKPLLALSPECPFYTLDNLDPKALLEVVDKIESLEEALVVSISKSGTTKETQLLSLTLKELFSNRLGKDSWPKHFLWLSDPSSFQKLDDLGWEGVRKRAIQFDGENDVGGRFSSPHTLIFLLPLFLLFDKNFSKLQDYYNSFVALKPEIQEQAYSASQECKDRPEAYFSPLITGSFGESFSSWIVQLFQESLGSKLKSMPVKTITDTGGDELFYPLKFDLKIDSPFVSLTSQMYFFQVFIAYYSAQRQVNFVTQNFVEKYKQQMHKLEGQGNDTISSKMPDLESIAKETKKLIQPEHRFIEVVLYFYPDLKVKEAVKRVFTRDFPQRRILIFMGSDWNHQSYQAAFGSEDTFYVLLTTSCYEFQISDISKDTLAKNTEALQVIAEATYLTLKDKSLLYSF